MLAYSPWKILPALLVAVLLTACSTTLSPPPPLVFDVNANIQTNNGRLFYFVVRSANEKQFMLESYKDVASKAFSDPPDSGVLGVFSIVPGTKQECTLNQPMQGMVALYFLFTDPGAQWKKLIATPFKDKYKINLKANSQVAIHESKPWYSWF